MKKFLSLLLAIAMVIPCFGVMAEDVSVNVAKMVTASDATSVYRNLASREAGEVAATVTLPADALAAGEGARLFIAKYVGNTNELDTVSVKEITSADNGTAIVTPSVTVGETDKVKAFIWKNETITPLAVCAEPEAKKQLILYDYETDETSTTGTNTSVVNSPVGTGHALKLQGTYNEEAGKQIAAASTEISFSNAIKEAEVPAYATSTYEFDMLIPSEWSYSTTTDNVDGTQTVSPTKSNVIYDFTFGSTSIYKLRMTISKDKNRIVFYNQGDKKGTSYPVLKDHYEKEQGLYDRWIHVKVEIRPYAPEGNDESCDEDYSQVYITFDNDTVVNEQIGPNTAGNLNNGLKALNGLVNELTINGESTTCWAKPIYIDNVKMSA